MELLFVTHNEGKVIEAQAKLEPLGYTVNQHVHEYPELQTDTLEQVARFGLNWLMANDPILAESTIPFILEDAGLFIESLNGFPGVYSAYAFKTIGYEGILRLMTANEPPRRNAFFEACIGLYDREATLTSERCRFFTGRCSGKIAMNARGGHGFGFDPIFIPEDEPLDRTFAELTTDEKNKQSHRARALDQLRVFLEKRKYP